MPRILSSTTVPSGFPQHYLHRGTHSPKCTSHHDPSGMRIHSSGLHSSSATRRYSAPRRPCRWSSKPYKGEWRVLPQQTAETESQMFGRLANGWSQHHTVFNRHLSSSRQSCLLTPPETPLIPHTHQAFRIRLAPLQQLRRFRPLVKVLSLIHI